MPFVMLKRNLQPIGVPQAQEAVSPCWRSSCGSAVCDSKAIRGHPRGNLRDTRTWINCANQIINVCQNSPYASNLGQGVSV